MKISIVATLYHSEGCVEEFYRRASDAARRLSDDDYQIILVNDGSPDNSLEIAVRLAEADRHVVVVDLSRNFGHHKAMMTGLAHAGGQHVFLIDSDLEEEPEWLVMFAQKMAEMQCDVVYGIQSQRKGGLVERWSGRLFYGVFNALTGMALPPNLVTARLMSRRYVDALLRHEEREVYLAGLLYITGFDQRSCAVTKHCKGKTTYTLRRKLSLFVNSITAFSNVPLVSIFYVGLSISSIASIYIAYLLINRIFLSTPLSGWTSVIASVWLLGGLIISFVGIVGIYLSKIFSEIKRRPYTIVRQIYGKQTK